MSVTRRRLARMLASTSLAAAALPAIQTGARAQSQTASDEETQSAHDQLRNNARQLAGVKLPMATEPPFHFKA